MKKKLNLVGKVTTKFKGLSKKGKIITVAGTVALGIALVPTAENVESKVEEPKQSIEQSVAQNKVQKPIEDNSAKNNVEKESVDKTVPVEYKSALKKATRYSDTMNMSKAGLFDQLTSEYGEKFSKEAAQYAIDNVNANWKENALKKAKRYQDTMSMSPSAIYDQLISDYGEKFTKEEAQYAINNLNK